MQAIDDQNLRALQIIIEAPGVDANVKNDWGMTAPMMACYSGYLEGLQYMLERKKADLKQRDNHGLNCEM